MVGTEVNVIIYGTALDSMLRGPNGDVVRLMMKRADYLQMAAKRQIRLGHVHGGSGYGNLRDSITKRVQSLMGTGIPTVAVGSSHPIALIHHEGTRPHLIRPRYKQALRWPGATASGFVFSKWARHPGTRPNRYLTDNLPAAMRID
jgi:hypothetical protein